jgi:Hpt domain
MDDYLSKPIDIQSLCNMLEYFDARRLKLAQTDPMTAEAEPATTGLPTLDRSVLLRVFEELGDDAPAVFDQLSVLFLQDTPELLKDLEAAFANRDFEQAARIAHRLKGSCG